MNKDYESELRDEFEKEYCIKCKAHGLCVGTQTECHFKWFISKLKQAESKESQLLMQTTNQLERTVEKLDKAESKLKKVDGIANEIKIEFYKIRHSSHYPRLSKLIEELQSILENNRRF
jgi:hypothetical protein